MVYVCGIGILILLFFTFTKRKWTLFFLLFMVLIQMPVPAHAELTELITRYRIHNQPVSEVAFSVYHIASVDKSDFQKFYLDEAYSKYQLDLDIDDDVEKAVNLAKLLESYAIRDRLVPVETLRTDQEGEIHFSGLTYGVYLLSGQSRVLNHERYTPVPVLFVFPYHTSDGSIHNSLTANVKYEVVTEPITQRVLINWVEDDIIRDTQRPGSVIIQLLRDGVVADEVSVGKDMGWTYTWENLDPYHTWSLIQKGVPSIYQTSASQTGITYTFTNAAWGAVKPPQTTDPVDPSPDTPDDEESGSGYYVRPQIPSRPSPTQDIPFVRPGGSGVGDFAGVTIENLNPPLGKNPSNTSPVEESGGQENKLPQTGQLWWPVPILLGLGFVFLLCGIMLRPKHKNG